MKSNVMVEFKKKTMTHKSAQNYKKIFCNRT